MTFKSPTVLYMYLTKPNSQQAETASLSWQEAETAEMEKHFGRHGKVLHDVKGIPYAIVIALMTPDLIWSVTSLMLPPKEDAVRMPDCRTQ